MTPPDETYGPEEPAELEFRKLLLGSAALDEVPRPEVEAAWSRFADAIGGASAAAAGAGAGLLSRMLHSTALRWWTLGAIAGGTVTALWLGAPDPHSRPARLDPGAQTRRADTATYAAPPAPQRAVPAPPVGSAPEVAGESVGRERVDPAAAARPARLRARPKRDLAGERAPVAASAETEGKTSPELESAAEAAPSRLAREVAALDAIRTAIRTGALRRALALADAYHREFPDGQLAADAEALAIESLARTGDRERLERRAAAFLRTYPGDTHRARVRALAERGTR